MKNFLSRSLVISLCIVFVSPVAANAQSVGNGLPPVCTGVALFNYMTGERCPTSTKGIVQGVSTTCYAITQTLGRGDTDDSIEGEVTLLQQYLETQGYSLSPKGNFGPLTETALKNWQTAKNLVATGVTDKFTRAKIGNMCAQ